MIKFVISIKISINTTSLPSSGEKIYSYHRQWSQIDQDSVERVVQRVIVIGLHSGRIIIYPTSFVIREMQQANL